MKKVLVLGAAHPHIYGIAAAAREVPQVELVGVWDADADRLAAAAEKLGAPAIGSLDDALALQPALVLIGAVPGERAGLATAAVQAGAAVLLDKPIAVTLEALAELRDAATRADRPVIAYYPYRGHPYMLAARAAIQAGRIGRVVRVFSSGPHRLNPAGRPDWHWTRAGNGGAMIDIGSHHVDLCCWLADQAPTLVAGLHCNLTQPDHPEFQDFAQAQLQFPDGALGHVEVDWLNPGAIKHFGDTRTWIQGATGKIEVRLGDIESVELWNDEVAGEALDTAPFQSEPGWGVRLIDDLASGGRGDIPQGDIWRASAVTLAAFDSASQGGIPLKPVM